MKVIVALAGSVFIQMALFECAVAHGSPADLKMLSLVPPGSEIVAGIAPTATTRHHGSFVLFTLANRIDYEDFLSLASADPFFQIDRLVFTASAGPSAATAEHSIIVSGRLQPEFIYKSVKYSSTSLDYRGVVVSVVRPLGRERSYFRQDRLFAVIDRNLAIFGTPLTVKEEIDRLLDGTGANHVIVQKVELLNAADDSWYLVRSPIRCAEFTDVLKKLDPGLSEAAGLDEMLFGIRYGKAVDFEFAAKTDVINQGESLGVQASVKRMFRVEGDRSIPAMREVKVGRGQFERWLKQVTGQ